MGPTAAPDGDGGTRTARPTPWEHEPERADLAIVALIGLAVVSGLALLPLTPSLLAHHPVVLEVVSGSTSAIVTVGALAHVGRASLVVGVLAAVPGCAMFDWVFWWAGRRWGHRAVLMFAGRWARRLGEPERWEHLAARWSWLAVPLAYFLPVPSPLVYAAAGLGRMRLRWFLLLDLIGALLWIGLLLGLGWALGQHAVDVVDVVNRYALWLTLALVAAVVAITVLRGRRSSRRGASR